MKKVPELRFPGFEVEWIKKELLDVSEIVMGQSPKSENYNNKGKGLPLIQGNADIKNKYTEPQMYTTESTKICNNGDIILTVRAPVGEVAKSKHKACIGRGVCAIQPNINNEYLYYFLLKNEKNWRKYSQGSTFEAVNSNDIKKFPVILSKSKQEQQKIADFFSTLDSRIEIQEEKIKNLEDQKKGYMQRIFSQEIRFKDENGEDYPEWEEKRLGEIIDYKSSSISFNSINVIDGGKFPLYDANSICGYLDYFDVAEDYVSIIKDGAGVGRVRYCQGKSSVLGTMGYLLKKESNSIRFMYYMLSCMRFDKYVVGGAIPHIYYKDYKIEKLRIPTLREQQKIGKFLSLLDEKIDIEMKILETLKEMKKGFLQKMFV